MVSTTQWVRASMVAVSLSVHRQELVRSEPRPATGWFQRTKASSFLQWSLVCRVTIGWNSREQVRHQ